MAKKATPVEVQAERNQATLDYHSEQDAIRIRTAKLREERLARAAEELKNPKPKVESASQRRGQRPARAQGEITFDVTSRGDTVFISKISKKDVDGRNESRP